MWELTRSWAPDSEVTVSVRRISSRTGFMGAGNHYEEGRGVRRGEEWCRCYWTVRVREMARVAFWADAVTVKLKVPATVPIPPAVEVVDFFPQAAMAKKAIRTEAAKRTGARRSLRCAPGRG